MRRVEADQSDSPHRKTVKLKQSYYSYSYLRSTHFYCPWSWFTSQI